MEYTIKSTLTSGLLNTSASGAGLLIMQNGSSAPTLTASSTSYVNGPMRYIKSSSGSTSLNFPIGTTPDCRPFVLTVNHSTATQYNYNVQLFNANPWTVFGSVSTDMPATVDRISSMHYWTIARTDAGGTSQPSANLSGNQQIQLYFGTNDGVYQGSSVTVVKNTATTTATWIDIGGTSTIGNFTSAQTGNVTSTSTPSTFTTFSSFSLGNKTSGTNPLPVELVSFSAEPSGNEVVVKWKTLSETNNNFFTIERSKDLVNFIKLMDVPGAGNRNGYRNYSEKDFNPYEGTSYYRLKQTDYDGRFKYFNIVPVTFHNGKQRNIIVFPNPIMFDNKINIRLIGYHEQQIMVIIRNIEGKDFLSRFFLCSSDDAVVTIDSAKPFPRGSYIINVNSGDGTHSYSLIVK